MKSQEASPHSPLPSPTHIDVLEFNRVLQDELYSLYFFFLYRSIYPSIVSILQFSFSFYFSPFLDDSLSSSIIFAVFCLFALLHLISTIMSSWARFSSTRENSSMVGLIDVKCRVTVFTVDFPMKIIRVSEVFRFQRP